MGRSPFRGTLAGLCLALAACSGGSNSGSVVGTSPPPNPPNNGDSGCYGQCGNAQSFLTEDDVRKVIAQGVAEARAQGRPATFVVVDRVGNVLAAYAMAGAPPLVTVSSGRPVTGGLEGLTVPAEFAAIAKALTSVYFSSEGNAFTSRTAGQIAQEHFNPGDRTAPSGPLFGVQFSQLPCSDISARFVSGTNAGPHRSPIGLSPDPGGIPLYKAGVPVGAVAAAGADDLYSLDDNAGDRDRNLDEYVALAAQFGFGPPQDRRADRITAGGLTLRYTDVEFSELARDPAAAPPFANLTPADGALLRVPGYADPVVLRGLALGTVESGIRPDTTDYPGLDAFVLDDGTGTNRYPPRAGTDGTAALTQNEVRTIVQEALKVAARTRAQVRKPLGSRAGETVVIVDSNGVVLALARSRDALVDAVDVTTQKARTAAFFSGTFTAGDIATTTNARYLRAAADFAAGRVDLFTVAQSAPNAYVPLLRGFLGLPAAWSDGQIAYSLRTIGNLSRPFYPDGVPGTPPGPLSLPFDRWSPFQDGLELDLVYNQIANHVAFYLNQKGLALTLDGAPLAPAPTPGNPTPVPDVGRNCTGIPRLPNGITLFGGGFPIYRGNTLIGGVAASGDGTDQSDLVAFLGLHNAGVALNTGVGNAPIALRADKLVPLGARLSYVQCPQSPFLDSTAQYVCEGK
ncbi:MAG TPA: heme-binding protein [Tahibacter sp.]|uniref:heme-binding protein n=1 Tax=Tahibacter sp. TaxID=2056211 RepID=UPI002C5725BD|nr:heme-binding protein [Tahibacter sp.]HSX59637.1 heme-binding protein [Tahibacter sp.]